MSLGKLTYFPVMAKGLQLALIAEFSGKEWEGETKTRGPGERDWPQLKVETPFGQMPFLATPEGLTVGQSVAIANYIGRKGDMLGKTDAEFAISQMCLAEGEDLYNMMGAAKLQRWQAPENRLPKEEVEKVWAEGFPPHLANLEKLCVQPAGFTSTGTTAGELYLFGMIYQMTLMRPDCLASFPALKKWFDTLAADPKTQKVVGGTSAIGTLAQYFINADA
uniref:Glutathione transferase n=1 Tax=Pyramimonas obovata TaxID=1411642 RepID=A0A7S0QY76_9CHLO